MKAFAGPEPAPGIISEILDGRDTLRIVKLRLALTLVAVALLPIATVAPIVRAVLDDTRAELTVRLSAESERAALEVQRELAGIRDTAGRLSVIEDVQAAIVKAAESGAADGAVDGPAAIQLRELLDRPSGLVIAVAVIDQAGSARARVGDPAAAFSSLPPPPAHRARYGLVGDATGAPTILEIAVGIPPAGDMMAPASGGDGSGQEINGGSGGTAQPSIEPAGPAVGAVVAAVPVSALLAWASPGTADSRSVELLDGTGRVLATVGGPDGINLPGRVIEFAANGSEDSEAQSAIELPGLGGWRIRASAPLPVTEIPVPAILALVGLIGLLIAFTWWMAHRILRPAATLETERETFRELYEAARAAALRDSLTGLGNHRAFQEAVAQMVDQSRRYGTPFSLILFDIDEFKRINDSRGHSTGDELLAEVGNLIRSTARQSDSGYRIGGDEFAILLPSTNAEGAEVIARRLLSRGLQDRTSGSYRGPISFSAGITSCPSLGTTRLQLTAQADAALYRGKRAGRTIVSIFDPARDRGHVDEEMRAELSAAVSAVIESGSLSPVYQPMIHLPTGRILGYEGLVRIGPDAAFPHTGALFDAAEVAGRVLELDRAALDTVLRGAHQIPEQTLLSLNVSPRSFEAPEFNATVLLSILRRHGVAPERVLLELTERDVIRDPERLRTTINQLQEAGVRVAADDVGAGNAGLRLLSQFRFDVVKIDLSLVQGGAGQDQTLSVLTSLVGLARRWGALTVAEGVETAAQLRMIRQLNIDAGQGYLLGRPGAALDVTAVDLDALAGDAAAGDAGAGNVDVVAGDGDVSWPVWVAAQALVVGPPVAGLPIPAPVDAAVPPASNPFAAQARSRPAQARSRPAQARSGPAPELTAASVIAGGAPNPFAHG